jgi:hypothetical protein
MLAPEHCQRPSCYSSAARPRRMPVLPARTAPINQLAHWQLDSDKRVLDSSQAAPSPPAARFVCCSLFLMTCSHLPTPSLGLTCTGPECVAIRSKYIRPPPRALVRIRSGVRYMRNGYRSLRFPTCSQPRRSLHYRCPCCSPRTYSAFPCVRVPDSK